MITPIWLLKYLPNMLACHISILLDCQGPSNTITEAEAASNVAIGEAARIIARGRADVMITGGADSKIHPLSLVRMSLLDQMSRWRGEPVRRLPAVRRRPGTAGSPAKGRGSSILEEREHALARGRQDLRRDPRLRLGLRRQPRRRARPRRGRHRDRHPGRPPRRQARRPARSATSTPTAPRRSSPTWPRPGRSAGSSAKGRRRRARHRAEGLHRQHRLRLRGRRADRQPARGQPGPDPAGPELRRARPGLSARSTWSTGAPRPTDNPIFLNTNLTRHGQAAALVVRGNPGVA